MAPSLVETAHYPAVHFWYSFLKDALEWTTGSPTSVVQRPCECHFVAPESSKEECRVLERLLREELARPKTCEFAGVVAPTFEISVQFVISFGVFAFILGLIVGVCLTRRRPERTVVETVVAGPTPSDEQVGAVAVRRPGKGSRGVIVQA